MKAIAEAFIIEYIDETLEILQTALVTETPNQLGSNSIHSFTSSQTNIITSVEVSTKKKLKFVAWYNFYSL